MMYSKESIEQLLQTVFLPGKRVNIVEQGAVVSVTVDTSSATIELLLGEEDAKFKKAIADNIRFLVSKKLDPTLRIVVVFAASSQVSAGIGSVKDIVAITSGKGGVGKSTITSNVAMSLARMGLKVGLIDADIFGPSIPKMFGVEDEMPQTREEHGKHIIIPVERYGVKILSIGFFVKKDESIAWRGPMASNALKQLINDADWGDLDILLFDTPPGTSDIHLTILQTLPLTGVVVVTTPQDVAVIDATRGIDLFRKETIDVPILGLVENMSWFSPAELPHNKYFIFGKGGGQRLAQEYNIPLLGEVPIVQGICEAGDSGHQQSVEVDSLMRPIFDNLAARVRDAIIERNLSMPRTKKVEITY